MVIIELSKISKTPISRLQPKEVIKIKKTIVPRTSIKRRVLSSVVVAGAMLGFLTACADVDINVKVDDASTVEYSYKATVLREDVDASGMITADEALIYLGSSVDTFEENGAKYEVIDADGRIGSITSTKGTYEGTKTLPELLPIAETPYLEVSKDANGVITVSIPVAEISKAYDIATKEDFKKAFTSFNVTIEFPGDVTDVSNNGKASGNTVTWTAENVYDATSKGQSLIAKGGNVSSGPPMLMITLGLILILALAGGGFLGYKKYQQVKFNKEVDAVDAEDEEYYRNHPEDRPQDDYQNQGNYQNQNNYQNQYGQQQQQQQQPRDQYGQQNQPQSPQQSQYGNGYNEQPQSLTPQNNMLTHADGQEIYSHGYLDGYEKGADDAIRALQQDNTHSAAPQPQLRPQQSFATQTAYEPQNTPQSQPQAYEPIASPQERPRRTLPPLPKLPPRNN